MLNSDLKTPARHSGSVYFPQLDRSVQALEGETIFQCARRNGLRIVGACGGRGTCGTCMIQVVEGEVAASSTDQPPRQRKWMRACQTMPQGDCVVEVAARSLAPVVRAEVDSGTTVEVLPLDPLVTDHDVTLTEATLDDTRSDLDRLMAALPVPVGRVDLTAARNLSTVLRDGDWSLRASLYGDELIGVAAPGRRRLGLAVDLGTTNAAAFLIDLFSGERIASLGIENPQTAWGADLISRVNHAVRGPDCAEELRRAGVDAINALAHDLCHAVGSQTTDIVDVVVCGNTAMHHLLLGLPVRQLGRAPFVAAVRDSMDIKARDLGLAVAPGAYVHATANIGGFVGGDHVTALLATEARWSGQGTSLVMDIGTNTEISLIHRSTIRSSSCPSGPALEGGHISCGMRAAEGAIERVGVDEGGHITVQTIGDKEPVGLCGSGVLDALATLLAAGAVDGRGRLSASHPAIITDQGKRRALLAPGVTFSQDDIRAVQLAKAAIRTGVELLLSDAGLVEGDIGQFIIAGAFGAYIDVKSGIAIGLFPDLPEERFCQVGNAAGIGVRQMVASARARARASQLAAHSRYVELSTRKDFQKSFMRHIGFSKQT